MIKQCPKLEFCLAPLGDSFIGRAKDHDIESFRLRSSIVAGTYLHFPLCYAVCCLLPPQINFLKTYKFDKRLTKAS
jgi:hypothetical protein